MDLHRNIETKKMYKLFVILFLLNFVYCILKNDFLKINISTLMDGPASHPTLFSTQTKHQLYFSQIFSGTSTLYRRSKSIIITLLLQIYEINTLLAYIPIPPKRSVGCSLLLYPCFYSLTGHMTLGNLLYRNDYRLDSITDRT